MADYYDALGIARDASAQEIKQAFRRIARESHPDANDGNRHSEQRFRAAAEAYEVLSDPERRAAYDRGDTIDLGDLFSSFAGVDDLLKRFFGRGFGGFGAPTRSARGVDAGVEVAVSLAEAATGAQRQVEFDALLPCDRCAGSGAEPGTELETCDRCGGGGSLRATRQTILGTTMSIVACDRCSGRGRVPTEPCSACAGRGSLAGRRSVSVEIPPGVDDRNRLRVVAGGHAGDIGQPAGDLIVEVRVEPDPRFERHGADLIHRVAVGLSEAALGTSRSIPTVDGGEEEIDLPPGTQPGTVLSLSRLGMPRLGRRGRGDLLVEVTLQVPEVLSSEQEEALRDYAEAAGERPTEATRKRRRKA